MWDVLCTTLAVTSLLVWNVNGQNPNSVYCEECTRCTEDIFHGQAYSCQGDSSFLPVCDCNTCGCSKGTENWCEIEILLGEYTRLFINFDDDANTKQVTIYGTPLINTLLEQYGPGGPRSTLWRTTLDGNLYCDRAEVKADICKDFAAVSAEIEELIRGIKNDTAFFKQLITALGSDEKNDILKGKLSSSIKFYFKDIEKLLEYSLGHCERIAEADPEVECVTDNMCPHPLKMCDRSDCTCHQCKEDSDCRHQAFRKFCRANTQDIMVCGDPHVSQSIKGIPERLCYDFIGQPGQSYLFLQENGLEITSKFKVIPGESHTSGTTLTEYVDEMTIKQDGVRIVIIPTLITVTQPNGPTLILDWLGGAKTRPHMTQIGQLDLTGKQCILYLKNQKTAINGETAYNGELRINIVRKGMARGRAYLNFGLTDIKGLSSDAKGIMGSLSNEVVFYAGVYNQSSQAQENNQHNMESTLQHNRHNKHNIGTILWSGNTFSVHKDKKQCWKIDDNSLERFNSMLQKFLIHEDS